MGVFELTNVESVGNLHDIYAFKYTPIITAIQNTSQSNLGAIFAYLVDFAICQFVVLVLTSLLFEWAWSISRGHDE